MPQTQTGAGRLIPASALEFSRYAKNLAWLLEVPLHFAQKILAACYGFSGVHELKATIPAAGEDTKPTGPFDAPRERPSFFPVETDQPYGENRLRRFTARELRLLRLSENVLYQRKEKDGRLRRRHYAVLDAGFFCAPSIHRKRFAEVKAGILAMEGTAQERERYLEFNWPPAFWTYLEATQLLRNDALDLSELKDKSIYFDEQHILAIGDMFHDTAAHRAPAIFLAMVGEDPEPDDGLPTYSYYDDIDEAQPSIASHRTGLFDIDDGELWYHTVFGQMPKDLAEDLSTRIFEMAPQELALSPPTGTPENIVRLARKWRLHQLRALSRVYVDSESVDRCVSRKAEMFWPGSPGNTITEESELVWTISREAPSLMVYSEFRERSRVEDEEEHRQFWSFKTLLTRTAPNEEEEVVGYMAGWLFVPATESTVCDTGILLEELNYFDDEMLAEGVEAFFKSYLPFNGFGNLLSFVNSRWHSSVAVTEIVLKDKYKKQELVSRAFGGLADAHQNAPYTDLYSGWLEFADFELATDADDLEFEPDVYIMAPSVFMVPVQRQNKKLRRYLMNLSVEDPSGDEDEPLDVFPFHYASSTEKQNAEEDA